MKDLLAKTGAAVSSACADVDAKSDIKDMGRYLISGFVNLRYGRWGVWELWVRIQGADWNIGGGGGGGGRGGGGRGSSTVFTQVVSLYN